ncbi:ADP-ribosylglycohydrolase family protein [Terrimonas sp. NA20]|uniref:ADP-ribosylglycohydrolase family protein n=1 Tax=Terrimonas ginsenosidimutans TaxID=2908004 RepID=A0ABS9KTW6_9BACT|nr:ADP-ribosylglycohydrolase family protein [Terrimonas ginsenosidimutans]MCG2615769.1 ADP-ribosylglycohydrolase family protein [Terrimonas ginsenosidimutans]
MENNNNAKNILLGVAVGDALGVPVEFKSREYLKREPVQAMIGYGTHHQPAGTWSDDSSLTFCLAETLAGKFDLTKLAETFVNWKNHGYWSAHGEVFDIGISTNYAIDRLSRGTHPVNAGGDTEGDNGNGSLMRILPLALAFKGKNVDQQFQLTKEVSSLTHGHIRSVLCCFIYLQIASAILEGMNMSDALRTACSTVNKYLDETATCTIKERTVLVRILNDQLRVLEESQIPSSGYVVSTLEASIWCLLNTDNFRDAVLKAVNLGNDTDTTGAVTGGLAALLYGWESIPPEWLNILARKDAIIDLAERLSVKTN